MFGIGFTELVMIAIVAILFLGPDKLPGAMVEFAKLIKSVKKIITDAKGSLEEEVKIAEFKEQAIGYKQELRGVTDELRGFKNISIEEIIHAKESYGEALTPAQKHQAQIEAQHKEMTQSVASIETKQEYAQIKTKPQSPQEASIEASPKIEISKIDETKKGDA